LQDMKSQDMKTLDLEFKCEKIAAMEYDGSSLKLQIARLIRVRRQG